MGLLLTPIPMSYYFLPHEESNMSDLQLSSQKRKSKKHFLLMVAQNLLQNE